MVVVHTVRVISWHCSTSVIILWERVRGTRPPRALVRRLSGTDCCWLDRVEDSLFRKLRMD